MTHRCRICASSVGKRILHLADMPLTDDFVNQVDPIETEYLHDIDIYQCDVCGIVQNPADFNHDDYYKDYQYSAGHSNFTRQFMHAYASEAVASFQRINGRPPQSVLEVGSGDGQQLIHFRALGVNLVKGIEPSLALATTAQALGIDTEVGLFGLDEAKAHQPTFDLCISSYTFDHVRKPVDYLRTAHRLLKDGGVLAIEIHDLDKIHQRTEFCLFEHEHTIYLTPPDAVRLLEHCGFSVISINPLNSGVTRGNSLIIFATKANDNTVEASSLLRQGAKDIYVDLQTRIDDTITRIDKWINTLPDSEPVIGFGAGGRGVMTLAALKSAKRFQAVLDSNYESNRFLTPKTRIPVSGPDTWHLYQDSYCLVFSYGYFDEITERLLASGFSRNKLVSLLDFYS